MKKTFAIHSPNDADILIRMHDDLVKEGFPTERQWNEYALSKSINSRAISHLIIYQDGRLNYNWFEGFNSEEHRDLTPDNYDAILQEIISAKD